MSLKIYRSSRHGSRGFTLVEVMVSLLILALGLLGMTALQNEALRFNQAAFLESQALFLAADMAERIRANHSSNGYALLFTEDAPEAPVDCRQASCTSAEMAAWDLSEWRSLLGDPSMLPGGEGAISFDALSNEYTISVRYDWSYLGGVDASEGLRTINLTTRIGS